MKSNKIKFVVVLLFSCAIISSAQESKSKNQLPSISLKGFYGETINISEITNQGHPIVFYLGATNCKSAVILLDEIAEDYQEWQDKTNVIIYYVATNSSRSSALVAPFVNTREWEYKVLLDPNSEFKHAMNAIYCPHILLLNGRGEIVWQKSGYTGERKEELYQAIFNSSKE